MIDLELYYPAKPWYVNQKFGETANLEYYKNNGVIFVGHNGIDAATMHGQPLYAAHDGVVEVQVDVNQGHGVVLRTLEMFRYKERGAYFKTIYWHMIDNIPVKTGQVVKAGELIGYADSTGLSTGDHLHFGLKPLRKRSDGTFYNVEEGNGTHGAIDPAPYFNNKYASDLSAKFVFKNDLEFGNRNPDVKQLQMRLKALGYFPQGVECTDFYGVTTRESVFKFQKDHLVLSWWARYVHRGWYCST
jgi:hypothetical protein